MNNQTDFIYDIEKMTDEMRSKTVIELDYMLLTIKQERCYANETGIVVFGESSPMPCRAIKLKLRPVPYRLDVWANTERLDEAKKHLDECEECQEWHMAGEPFEFDMKWDKDRKLFCNSIKIILEHKHDWPLSYKSALTHADKCPECNEYNEYVQASHSCEKTRDLLKDDYLRDPCFTNFEIMDLLDNHVDRCFECQKWCRETISCDRLRDSIKSVVSDISYEWKSWRCNSLGTTAEYHLRQCVECKLWVVANIERNWDTLPIFYIFEPTLVERERSRKKSINEIKEEKSDIRDAMEEMYKLTELLLLDDDLKNDPSENDEKSDKRKDTEERD